MAWTKTKAAVGRGSRLFFSRDRRGTVDTGDLFQGNGMHPSHRSRDGTSVPPECREGADYYPKYNYMSGRKVTRATSGRVLGDTSSGLT